MIRKDNPHGLLKISHRKAKLSKVDIFRQLPSSSVVKAQSNIYLSQKKVHLIAIIITISVL